MLPSWIHEIKETCENPFKQEIELNVICNPSLQCTGSAGSVGLVVPVSTDTAISVYLFTILAVIVSLCPEYR